MKKFTNHAQGARGIRTGDGMIYLDPGQTVEIDPKSIIGALPDLGEVPAKTKSTDDDADQIAALKAQVTDLTKQVEALGKDKADLTKQVEALSKKP